MEGWKSYEEVAAYLLNHFAKEFGLTRLEGKQTVHGLRSEIDAKGVCEGPNQGFVIIECRRYTSSRQNQEKLGSLAYKILDTGASGGIIVSVLGLQEGAAKIGAAEDIIDVQLNANCTPDEFALKFLNRLMIGVKEIAKLGEAAVLEAYRNCRVCGRSFKLDNSETVCPDCIGKD